MEGCGRYAMTGGGPMFAQPIWREGDAGAVSGGAGAGTQWVVDSVRRRRTRAGRKSARKRSQRAAQMRIIFLGSCAGVLRFLDGSTLGLTCACGAARRFRRAIEGKGRGTNL